MPVKLSPWLPENSIPKTICHHFWVGLTLLPKSMGTYSGELMWSRCDLILNKHAHFYS
jgi:hypothetical protein